MKENSETHYIRRLDTEKISLLILIKVDGAERRWKLFKEHGEFNGTGLNVSGKPMCVVDGCQDVSMELLRYSGGLSISPSLKRPFPNFKIQLGL